MLDHGGPKHLLGVTLTSANHHSWWDGSLAAGGTGGLGLRLRTHPAHLVVLGAAGRPLVRSV